jgi:hypothetical protein
MGVLHGKCAACGAPVARHVPEAFAGAALVAPLCAECTDRCLVQAGGAVLRLRADPDGTLFPLDKVVVTAGAVAALADAGEHAVAFLARHARGDWGDHGHCDAIELTEDERRRGWEATEDDAKINKSNLLQRRDQVLSAYRTGRGTRLWVVTRLGGDGETTVLTPDEY